MEILSQLIDYLPIIGRTLLMYLIIISLLRIYGQKQIADLNLQDFVLVLLIAETSQHAMLGEDATLLGGVVSLLTPLTANKIMNIIFQRFPALRRKVEPQPWLIINQGTVLRENMEKINLNPDELQELLRENGLLSVKDVKYAIMEIDGSFSVIPNNS